MPRSENQKLKLLYLSDYLMSESSESNPLSVKDIISYLATKDISVERKTVYADINSLIDYGMDIIHLDSGNHGYYVASREFELPEIKVLVDAVMSSKFLTTKKSSSLIKKLAKLASKDEEALINRQIFVKNRAKTDHEGGYYNVDAIANAIQQNKKISYKYFSWGVDKEKHYREKRYQVSPIVLVWADENYYMVARTDEDAIRHFRVDKMSDIATLRERRKLHDSDKNFDTATYSKQVFGMFFGEIKKVKVEFENSLAGVVIDRFGTDSMLIRVDENHFSFTTDVAVSPTYLGWLAGFGNKAKIIFPQSVVDEYVALCKSTLAQYE